MSMQLAHELVMLCNTADTDQYRLFCPPRSRSVQSMASAKQLDQDLPFEACGLFGCRLQTVVLPACHFVQHQ